MAAPPRRGRTGVTADRAENPLIMALPNGRILGEVMTLPHRTAAARGVQAECIKLNGAIELAPHLGLCRHIVDLVQTGATLKANGLVEIERIAEVSSRLIVNRPALKTRPEEVGSWIERFRDAIRGQHRAPFETPAAQAPQNEGIS